VNARGHHEGLVGLIPLAVLLIGSARIIVEQVVQSHSTKKGERR
jgi:hypothetical protein